MVPPSPAGELLRRARQDRQESLREAAANLTITPSHLSRLERGEKGASDELLSRAAAHYGLDPTSLVDTNVPRDVIEIIENNPELVEELRNRYGLR